jgi:hypothetical protein
LAGFQPNTLFNFTKRLEVAATLYTRQLEVRGLNLGRAISYPACGFSVFSSDIFLEATTTSFQIIRHPSIRRYILAPESVLRLKV